MTEESAALREAIRSGRLQPEAWRDQEKPDYRSAWENAVRRIYEVERAIDPPPSLEQSHPPAQPEPHRPPG